ncbi:hypothetical protein FHS27_006187 [Rhodopirellula rubra]|uniref:Uncharacterized protein n=1 Tax=Aporhodopirellula rubra TaxID=980271 RepID=A0A7W5H9P4_9BACT|nr:hypothetical protein [Aporhodopirellula rubra]
MRLRRFIEVTAKTANVLKTLAVFLWVFRLYGSLCG